MRWLLCVIATAAALVAMVTGCGGAPSYDGRLVAADSLMHDRPDSALALVEAVSADSLPVEADRAYRDLLLTQARYRCYVTATSDSAISRALSYYRCHDGEREKLTRCYIYKGAVMEELGHPDSAMYYYKYAEATAATDDYFNLGYVKLRIATLYLGQYSQDTTAIFRYKQAIRCFKMLNDTNYLITCYGDLGSIYGTASPDSSEYYLILAIKLAQEFDSSQQYTYKSSLAGLCYYSNDYKRANSLAMDVFRDGKDQCNENQFYYYAIMSFLKLGQLDSAKAIMQCTPSPVNAVDSMNWLNAIAEISRAENEIIDYNRILQTMDIKQNILSGSKEKSLITMENNFDKKLFKTRAVKKLRRNHVIYGFLVFLLVLLIVFSALRYYRTIELHKKAIEQLEQELLETIKNLQLKQAQVEQEKRNVLNLSDTISQLHEKQKELVAMHSSASELFSDRIEALNELFNSIKFKYDNDDKDGKSRSIIPLSGVLKGMSKTYHLMDVELTEQFWEKMKRSVDGEYHGIISDVEKSYPSLTEQDLRLLCLLCSQLSPQLIKLCMNYSNAKTVSNYKKKLIRDKMRLDMSFEEFLQQYQNRKTL